MTLKNILVVPIGTDDWIVREEGGRELGHYPSQQDALHVGRKLARKRRTQLLIHDHSGEPSEEHQPKGFFATLLGR